MRAVPIPTPSPEFARAGLRAAEALYDRVYGESKQRHEVEASTGPIPEAELETWSDEKIEARLKELEAESGPESEEGG